MTHINEKGLSLADDVRKSLAIENALSPIQARSFVRCLQSSWDVSTITWSEAETKSQLSDAKRLILAAEIFKQSEDTNSSKSTECYRRASELLEWLSRAKDRLQTIIPVELYAAAAYQLGGLPAMASGLLRQAEISDEGSLLFSYFLRADFSGVLKSVASFWYKNSELTDRDASNRLLAEESEDKISWYLVVELVRSIGLIADSLQRGNNERLSKALKKLKSLDDLATRIASDDISLLVTLICAVGERYKETSIYNPILQLAALHPNHANRLKAFARRQYIKGRGILWSSQQHGIERLLQTSSFALCTPTGSGKTLVANLALVKELMLVEKGDFFAPLGLYLVPSRALAGEVEAKLTEELGQDFIITCLYGGSDWGITDYWVDAERPTVLIATVEKADALMRYLGPILLARLRLLIIDEAHQVVSEKTEYTKASFAEHNNRSLKLEGFVSRIIAQSPDIVRIALTAVAGGADKPVSQWIEGNKITNPVNMHYKSTRQVVGILETTPSKPGKILLDFMNDRKLSVQRVGTDESLYINLKIPVMPILPAVMRDSLYHFNQLSILWTALHLAESGRRILISVMQDPEMVMKRFVGGLALAEWKQIIKFTPPNDKYLNAKYQETYATCIDYCGENSFELILLKHGIATNHGQMPQRLRRLMTYLIDHQICPITVATSTLTEGVNLPFDIIFLTSLKRTLFDYKARQLMEHPLSTSEFRNLIGRAGRPGSANGMEGMALIAIPQAPSTTAKKNIRLQQSQITKLKKDYKDLHNKLCSEQATADTTSPLSLLIETISDLAASELNINKDNFVNWLENIIPSHISGDVGTGTDSSKARLADSLDELDGFLLTALEELSDFNGQEMQRVEAEEFLARVWQRTFSYVALTEEERLEKIIIKRGGALIENIYPNADERKRFYQYGFTPQISRRFEETAPKIKNILLMTTGYAQLDDEEKLSVFIKISDLLAEEGGFGFRIRDNKTAQDLLNNRNKILMWWMKCPKAISPDPDKLRTWQKFVTENLEFRLGIAIGAVVAQSWSLGTNHLLEIPSLAVWKKTTDLPWFAFWAKELLKWGTLDPFVAFALTQGLAKTRNEAMLRRREFEKWLKENINQEIVSEDLIDPQFFLKWQASLPHQNIVQVPIDFDEVQLTGTDGRLGRYNVIPIIEEDNINWIDASGFSLARSNKNLDILNQNLFLNDYFLLVDNKGIRISKE